MVEKYPVEENKKTIWNPNTSILTGDSDYTKMASWLISKGYPVPTKNVDKLAEIIKKKSSNS